MSINYFLVYYIDFSTLLHKILKEAGSSLPLQFLLTDLSFFVLYILWLCYLVYTHFKSLYLPYAWLSFGIPLLITNIFSALKLSSSDVNMLYKVSFGIVGKGFIFPSA